jgi:uncharacterized membrane protein YphA (DoxX/SURF4 family)
MKIFIWICRIIASIIMLQTLYFKFTAAPESIYIFSTLGIEPWGRIGTGIIELIAGILILFPTTSWMGAGLGLGTMMSAIISHIFILGIDVQNDKGQLFFMALVTAICCTIILYVNKKIIQSLIPFLKK